LYDQHEDEPQSWNLYSYVRNNPLAYVDPNGKETCYYSTDKDGNKRLVGCDDQKGFSIKDNVLTYKGKSHKLEDLDAQEVVRECGCAVGHEQQIPYAEPDHQFDWNDRTGAKGIAGLAGTMVLNPLPNPHKFVIGGGLLLGAGLAYLTNYRNLPPPVLIDPNIYAKGGKQNIRNEWNDAAVREVGNNVAAQIKWLQEAYKNANDSKVKQKIKEAQKAIGGRKSSGGGGQ
jgi:hypothetical protein